VFFDGAAKLHTRITGVAENAELKFDLEIMEFAVLPDNELIAWRIQFGGGFTGNSTIGDAEITHIGRRPTR